MRAFWSIRLENLQKLPNNFERIKAHVLKVHLFQKQLSANSNTEPKVNKQKVTLAISQGINLIREPSRSKLAEGINKVSLSGSQ